MAEHSKKSRGQGPLWKILFALPFLAFGIGTASYASWVAVRYYAAQSWVEVPATIKAAGLITNDPIGRRQDESGPTFRATATYEYDLGGQHYTGTRVGLHSGGDNLGNFQRDAAAELIRHRDSGKPFHCYVNPRDPTDALLFRNVRWELMLLYWGLCLVLGGMGVGFATSALVAKTSRAAAAPALDVPDEWLGQVRAFWAKGRMEGSETIASTRPITTALAVWCVLAALPIVLTLPAIFRQGGSPWRALTLVPPAMAGLFTLLAPYYVVHRGKFGSCD